MKYEDTAIATIAKQGATEFSNLRRCLDPALRFRIKYSKSLQLSVLIFIQKLDTHSSCQINSVASRVNTFLFPFLLPLSVVTDTSTAIRAFR